MSDIHLPTGSVLVGDVLDRLSDIPDGSVQTCVTSPPYFGLRDYGVRGQIGLEPTPEEYIAKMVAVFRAVRRVLRDDGTLWVNMGDSYAQSGGAGNQGENGQRASRTFTANGGLRAKNVGDVKPKDLLMIPAQLALALRADGWYLRSDIIWSKPNPMPESVTDRPTSAHEHIFLLAKSATYFYDAAAIAEPMAADSAARYAYAFGGAKNEHLKETDKPTAVVGMRSLPSQKGKGGRNAFRGQGAHRDGDNGPANREGRDMRDIGAGDTRNKRNVWEVATRPYSEAHFATFPPELIRPCIKAGSRPGDTVLDPFMGSGTTGMVAVQEGRRWVGVELNPKYAQIARKRILGAQPPLLLEAAHA